MHEKIRFQIEALDYQEDAVNAVIDLLKGVERQTPDSFYRNRADRGWLSSRPEANARFHAGTRLLQNLNAVQYRNGLFKDKSIAGDIPQFTVEMETGTGKTFVYLETILRLWSEFDGQFKKFIIVVPSNPILMGVRKSIETFADFFKPKFNNIDLSEHFFVFDRNVSPEMVTAKLIESTELSIMLITNHSFNKEQNRLRRKSENGIVVWDDIRDISPIIIIDEPQKLDGDGKRPTASMKAIEELAPPMILRYSATHRNKFNPVYKLDSYDAYRKKLVKSIKVTTVHSLTRKDFPYVRYVGFTPKLQARIELFSQAQGDTVRCKKFDVDSNASLEALSGGLPQYHNWYIAAQPRKNEPLQISRNDGSILLLDEGRSNDDADHAAAVEKQMEIAIRAHLRKQAEILASGRKIKVLTLFFVDSVAKVRGDGEDGRGEYLRIFDSVFERIRSQPSLAERSVLQQYPKEFSILDPAVPVSQVRGGYFAVDRKHHAVEVKGWNSELDDESVHLSAKAQEDVDRGIDLILNKKDELISFEEPLSFLFSHSALREGWDNPNVFVLVTLKEGGSDIAKKQEIGRGLRLPVDSSGARCYDSSINELTVVANDHFDHFVSTLQTDYNRSSGFDRNEVSADIIRLTMQKAGVPADQTEAACDAFQQALLASGAAKIDRSGKLLLTNAAEAFQGISFHDPILIGYAERIIAAFTAMMQDKGSSRIEIVNGDEAPFENRMQSYVSEEEFAAIYRRLLAILQKRTVYRYRLDTEAFIAETAAELEKLLAKDRSFVQLRITKADVDFGETRSIRTDNAQIQTEDSSSRTAACDEMPLTEIVNRIMMHTMLPRLAIIQIIQKLSDSARKQLRHQEQLEDAVSVVNRMLTAHKSKQFLEAELVAGAGAAEKDIFEVDRIADETEIRYLFTPNPAHRRALNLRYRLDSEGELRFARALDDDPNVLLYTKLKKGGFVIETPAGNYSPDWAVVYQKHPEQLAMYFIAETKWSKSESDLSETEKIKIRCAAKHFAAINGSMTDEVRYAWVNAYNDCTHAHSFPQAFLEIS